MRILGIDPGIGRTGWGVIEKQGEQKALTVAYGCLETTKETALSIRLKEIYQGLTEIIAKYEPKALAVEELFFNVNTKTALVVGQARGVVLLVAANNDIPVFTYTPLQVKMGVAGYGRAEKKQVGEMVKLLLKLKAVPKPDDTADALAIALTHAFTTRYP